MPAGGPRGPVAARAGRDPGGLTLYQLGHFGENFLLPVRNPRLRAVVITVAYTFIRPFMERQAAASSELTTVVLIVFGSAAPSATSPLPTP